MKQQIRSAFLLFLATLIWGSAFIAQTVGMDGVGPITFQAIRCAMGAIGLLPVIYFADRGKTDGKTFFSRFLDKKLLLGGLCCAIPLFFAVNLQQLALVTTDAGKSAFLTAMYIVFVPIFGTFIRRRPSFMMIPAVLIAVTGLYFLSCVGQNSFQTGAILLLLCAAAFAVQILFVDHFASNVDCLRLNCLQAFFCAITSTVTMFFTESPTVEGIQAAWWPMCYAGFLSMGLAYSLQIIGQKGLDPTVASLIMSLESVVAVICGALFLRETMTKYESIGCILMLVAIVLSQIPQKQKKGCS